MTISSENRKSGPFVGTGAVSEYPFDFTVFSAADLLVVKADENLAESTLVLDSDYTVDLNADQDSSPGGTVTLTNPLPADHMLAITSGLAALQPTDLTNQGGFYPQVVNASLDRLTILIQQLKEQVSRSLKVSITSDEEASPDALIGQILTAVTSAEASATAASGFATAAEEFKDDAEAAAAAAASKVSKTGDTGVGSVSFGLSSFIGKDQYMDVTPAHDGSIAVFDHLFVNPVTNSSTYVGAAPSGASGSASGYYAMAGAGSLLWGGLFVNPSGVDIHSTRRSASGDEGPINFKFRNVTKVAITRTGVIQSYGIQGRQGTSGGTFGNAVNLYFSSPNLQAWVDTINLGNITITSDYRIKRDIRTMEQPALERIAALRPVLYQYADNEALGAKAEDREREGFIAHELAEVIPSAVEGEKDAPNQIQSLRIDALVAVLVKAVQEQQEQINELRALVGK